MTVLDRVPFAVLVVIGAALAIVVWTVATGGSVNMGYVRSGGPSASATVQPAGAGPAAPPASSAAVADPGTPPRQLIVPDVMAVVPGGITAAQLTVISELPGVRAVLAADGGQVTVNGQPATVLGVPMPAFRSWAPPVTAASTGVWTRLAGGQLIASSDAASRLGLAAGNAYGVSAATSTRVTFGAAALLNLPGVDAIVDSGLSARLGLASGVAVLINAPAASLATLMSQVRSLIGTSGTVANLVPAAALPADASLPVDASVPAGRPANYLELYQESAAGYCPGLSWTVLAAIGEIESGDGANDGPSSAGALGPMQFMPSTWKIWGTDGFGQTGPPDIMDPLDAVPSAARMLCADGAAGGGTALAAAIFDYNHAHWYVTEVLDLAAEYAREYS
jgi:transglycosylase-like protein with SLT domain